MSRPSTAIVLGGLLLVPAHVRADVKMDDDTKRAVAKALQWLASKQNTDGSFSEGGYQHNTAITAFALLAFMSQGHLPGQGLYGPEVAKGARFLVSASRADGYLVGSRGGNMYCHGLATLALAELWGMAGDAEVKSALVKAVDLIVRSQNREGGWRYDPQPTGADVSVTIMQVMALRAAKNGGLHVPDETLKRAIAYVNRCYNPQAGGFTYMPSSGRVGFARTAAGACVLQLTGAYEAREIPQAIEYLQDHFHAREHFWYGHYYAAHAMHQVGGPAWEAWYAKLRETLLPMQAADGGWTRNNNDSEGVGPVYTTSIAVITLSVPAGYLPIFQR